MKILIRPYKQSDLETVVSVWGDGWRSTGVAAAHIHSGELLERFPREVAGGWDVHVAEFNGEIVGFAAIHDNTLEQLFVRSASQNAGVGKRLLDWVKTLRPTGFWLTTAAESRSPKFYEREGLVRGPTSIHPRFGHPMVRYDWRPKSSKALD